MKHLLFARRLHFYRIMRTLPVWFTLIILAMLGIGTGCRSIPMQPSPIPSELPEVIASGAIVEQEIENIQRMLLSLPDRCEEICFWQIEPGHVTYEEFKQILLKIFVTLQPVYEDEDIRLSGVHSGRVNFSAGPKANTVPDDTVDYISLDVYPSDAKGWYDISAVTPSTITEVFGVPDDAFIYYFPNTNGYTVYFYYALPALVYEINGMFKDGAACLTLDEIESLSLNRFPNGEEALNYIRRWENPPSKLTDVVAQSVDDLASIAENPDTFCWTLVSAAP